MLTLRPYQGESVVGVRNQWDAGHRTTLLELPTGCGKTVVFAELCRAEVEVGHRALVLAHRTELLTQAQAKLGDAGVWAELEQAKRRGGLAPVVVASVQTLKGKRLASFDPDAFDLVVVDEAHHATAAGYRAILDHFASARVLGVTATPDRADGTGLGEVFESVAYRYAIRQAIADGYLVPLVCRRVDVDGVDLSGVKTRAGDLAQDQLAAIMNDERALHGVVVPLLEETAGMRGIVFGVDVAHAHALAEVANRYEPGCARAVDGSASAEEREQVLADFRAGAFRILFNCALFTEGFDEPGIQFVAIARPTKSRPLYAQMVGRGTRPLVPPMEATAEERRAAIAASRKPNVLVLDFTGEAGRHSLIGPVDVLAGRELDDDIREEVKKRLEEGEQLELDELLEHAEKTVRERREKAGPIAVAKYFAEDFDPFAGPAKAVDIPKPEAWETRPATPGQLAALKKWKLKEPPEGLSMADASRMIDACARRKDLGLCSIAQAKLIKAQLGIDASEMSELEAGKKLSEIRSRWSALKSYRRSA